MLVSICIPVFNMASCVRRAITSALAQTYSKIEVIVVDNQSTDGTYEVASSILDPRLRVVRNETNLGAYGNHNRCLELAKGEWMKFLHGDDELLPHCVAEMAAAVSCLPKDTALIGCGAIRQQDGRESERTYVPDGLYAMRPTPPREFVLLGNFFGTPTMTLVHRRRFLDAGGFDLNMEPAADGDGWINLRGRYPSAYVPSHLVFIRDDPPGQIREQMASSVKWCRHTFRLVEKWHQQDELFRDQPLVQTIYGEWLVRETFRYWDASLRFLLLGRPTMAYLLWKELGHRHLGGRSLRHYLMKRIKGRNATTFRDAPWPVILSHLQLPLTA